MPETNMRKKLMRVSSMPWWLHEVVGGDPGGTPAQGGNDGHEIPNERCAWRPFYCAPETIRTSDTRFRRAVLYPLSYEGVTSCPRPL